MTADRIFLFPEDFIVFLFRLHCKKVEKDSQNRKTLIT